MTREKRTWYSNTDSMKANVKLIRYKIKKRANNK